MVTIILSHFLQRSTIEHNFIRGNSQSFYSCHQKMHRLSVRHLKARNKKKSRKRFYFFNLILFTFALSSAADRRGVTQFFLDIVRRSLAVGALKSKSSNVSSSNAAPPYAPSSFSDSLSISVSLSYAALKRKKSLN